jgi:hypothetical protein
MGVSRQVSVVSFSSVRHRSALPMRPSSMRHWSAVLMGLSSVASFRALFLTF